MIQPERIISLHSPETNGKYVLLWVQQAQRARFNHALEFAVKQANDMNLPLFACFVITDNFPEANLRHYAFMLQGLAELRESLKERGISLIFLKGNPPESVAKAAKNASLLVTDRGYLRIQKQWRREAAAKVRCTMVQVESDVVVPVEAASNKEEFAAYTLRPKIHKLLDKFLVPLEKRELKIKDFMPDIEGIEPDVRLLKLDNSVAPCEGFIGGESQAHKRLADFTENKLHLYDKLRNDPSKDMQSNLAPYLHFGQISPLEAALAVRGRTDAAGFLEELIVRRELAVNMVNFNPDYDSLKPLHPWAAQTLKDHEKDARTYTYTVHELENAQTRDSAWNAAQNEMLRTGKMHGYMRMYWGKKIIEWTKDTDTAYKTAIYLNNRYSLDGRDSGGFSGVLWCFGKHDRPWAERSIFGKVRYMNYEGLKRKFDIKKYEMNNS